MVKVIVILVSVIALFFLGAMLLGWLFSAPVYTGPATAHFNGKKFVNPWGVEAKGFRDMLKWVRHRDPGPWISRMDLPPGPKPAERVHGDSINVTFVNHSTFLIQTRGVNILTDPVWSERASPVGFAGPKRMRPPLGASGFT